MLSMLFGIVAAVLVAIGLYGLLAYSVTRRTREIGLRIAIGATARDVIGMVVRGGLALVSIGLVIGVPLALLMKAYATRVLATVASTQAVAPVVLPVNLGVPLFLSVIAMVAVALLASFLPARRATRVDPMSALRAE